jgi:HEAT repeat protein
MKKKGFELARRLVDAKVPDPNTRRSALDVLVRCDPAGAPAVLGALAKDKDKFVAEGAKKALDALKAKGAKKP